MRLLAVVFLCGVLPGPAGSQERPPVIDMHMHARFQVPRTETGAPVPRPCMPTPCEVSTAEGRTDGDGLQLTIDAMDRHNIVLGFLSDSIDRVYRWVDGAPGRFIASPLVRRDLDRVDLSALADAYKRGRLGGMGEIATQYEGIAPNDHRLDPFYTLAIEFDVPVLIHTEGIAGRSPAFRIAHGHPELLQDVLVKYPDLRLYFENAGYPFLDEMIALMYRYPNVYADLSTITWIIPREAFYVYLKGLMDAGLGERLMFGSDQMSWPEVIDLAMQAIDKAPFLTHEHKRDILYNNAARFLRLSEAEIAKHHGRN